MRGIYESTLLLANQLVIFSPVLIKHESDQNKTLVSTGIVKYLSTGIVTSVLLTLKSTQFQSLAYMTADASPPLHVCMFVWPWMVPTYSRVGWMFGSNISMPL